MICVDDFDSVIWDLHAGAPPKPWLLFSRKVLDVKDDLSFFTRASLVQPSWKTAPANQNKQASWTTYNPEIGRNTHGAYNSSGVAERPCRLTAECAVDCDLILLESAALYVGNSSCRHHHRPRKVAAAVLEQCAGDPQPAWAYSSGWHATEILDTAVIAGHGVQRSSVCSRIHSIRESQGTCAPCALRDVDAWGVAARNRADAVDELAVVHPNPRTGCRQCREPLTCRWAEQLQTVSIQRALVAYATYATRAGR